MVLLFFFVVGEGFRRFIGLCYLCNIVQIFSIYQSVRLWSVMEVLLLLLIYPSVCFIHRLVDFLFWIPKDPST